MMVSSSPVGFLTVGGDQKGSFVQTFFKTESDSLECFYINVEEKEKSVGGL